MLPAAFLLVAVAEPAPAPPRSAPVTRTATIAVRARVEHSCTISSRDQICRGAAGDPPVRRTVESGGVVVVEF